MNIEEAIALWAVLTGAALILVPTGRAAIDIVRSLFGRERP